MNKTGITYTDFTWNPIAMRCQPCSPGCLNCWHIRMAKRLAGNPKINTHKRRAYSGQDLPLLDAHELMAPTKKRKASAIAVQFMGDLFFEGLILADIFPVFNIISLCEAHTFLTLTKRIWFMHRFLTKHWIGDIPENIFHGLTVCNQDEADEKIPQLLDIPGRRWLSVEPMLEVIDIRPYLHGIDYVVAGCESGTGRRPSENWWFDRLEKQCTDSGVPFYLKQIDKGGGVEEMPFGDENVPPWQSR